MRDTSKGCLVIYEARELEFVRELFLKEIVVVPLVLSKTFRITLLKYSHLFFIRKLSCAA